MNSPALQVTTGAAADLMDEELRRLEWFANYLDMPFLDPPLMSADDYAAIIAAAVDKYGVLQDRLCERFGINKSTVSRWKNGRSAPQPFARELIIDWIKSDVAARIVILRDR